jgi:hypothetical protein
MIQGIREYERRDGAPWVSVKYQNLAYVPEFHDAEFVDGSSLGEFWRSTTLAASAGFKPSESVAQELRNTVEEVKERDPLYNQARQNPFMNLNETTEEGLT